MELELSTEKTIKLSFLTEQLNKMCDHEFNFVIKYNGFQYTCGFQCKATAFYSKDSMGTNKMSSIVSASDYEFKGCVSAFCKLLSKKFLLVRGTGKLSDAYFDLKNIRVTNDFK
jgi:hypothetical protein